MKKRERYKKLINGFEMLVLMVMHTYFYAMLWYGYYSELVPKKLQFYRRGHWAVIAMYVLVLWLFIKLYGGFKVGYLRLFDVIYSQFLSLLCANVVLYFQICMLTREYVTPVPLLIMTAVQAVVILIWVFVCRYLYMKLYPPRNLLLVYGEKTPVDFINKINARKDKYFIHKKIHVSEGMEKIKEAIAECEGVMICETASHPRNEVLKYCFIHSVRTYVVPKVTDLMLIGSDEMHLFDTPLLLSRNQGLTGEQQAVKRIMDIVLSLIACVIASPFMLVIAVAIKAYDRGPVIYKQIRLTKDGKEFYIYKFRSMGVDAEKGGARLAMKNDSRVTPVGKVIRNLHLDELPQLFNILKGDMSFVGPRPERPEIFKQYEKELPEFAFRLKVKAGLTGYAQVYGKYNTTPRDKVKLDVAYIEHYSVWLDIKLMLLTFKILFQKENTEGVDQNQTTALKADKGK